MAKKYKAAPKKKAGASKGKNTSSSKKKIVKTTEDTPQKVVSTASSTKSSAPRKTRNSRKKTEEVLPFGRMNYILLLIGIGIIGFGFFLLSLDDFVDATEFSVSLYIAPVVIVAGFVEIIYAIMYKDQSQSVPETADA